MRSSRGLRRESLEVFDRTFLITGVLRLLAVVVALVGVLSALMALQLDRERELGVLRALGLTPAQLWAVVTSQTVVLGLIAGLLAVPLGWIMAVIMVRVINLRSFGWTIELRTEPGPFPGRPRARRRRGARGRHLPGLEDVAHQPGGGAARGVVVAARIAAARAAAVAGAARSRGLPPARRRRRPRRRCRSPSFWAAPTRPGSPAPSSRAPSRFPDGPRARTRPSAPSGGTSPATSRPPAPRPGAEFGYQLTFFRSALAADPPPRAVGLGRLAGLHGPLRRQRSRRAGRRLLQLRALRPRRRRPGRGRQRAVPRLARGLVGRGRRGAFRRSACGPPPRRSPST